MKRIFLFLISSVFIFPLASMGSEKARIKVPKEARIQFQKMWKEERAKRIPQATRAMGLSFAATYIFSLVGLAGHYNWTSDSIAAYSPLFFNLSLASAVLTWHYYSERKSLIKKKTLSKDEIYATYIKMKTAQQFQANQV